MSIAVSSRVWDECAQSGDRLLLMLALAEYANDQGECWPSQAALAKRTRCSERGVQKMIDALIGAQEIVLVQAGGGRGRSAEYSLRKYAKGERGSPFAVQVKPRKKGEPEDVKGEPESPNTDDVKGEPESRKGEPEDVKGEPAVPPNHQRTVNEPLVAADAPKAGRPFSDHQDFVDRWCAYYQKTFGEKYSFQARDGKAVKLLLAHFGGHEKISAFIGKLHARLTDGYPFSNTGSLHYIANNISPLQVALQIPSKANGKASTNHRPTSDRNAGTANEGRAADYSNVGKI